MSFGPDDCIYLQLHESVFVDQDDINIQQSGFPYSVAVNDEARYFAIGGPGAPHEKTLVEILQDGSISEITEIPPGPRPSTDFIYATVTGTGAGISLYGIGIYSDFFDNDYILYRFNGSGAITASVGLPEGANEIFHCPDVNRLAVRVESGVPGDPIEVYFYSMSLGFVSSVEVEGDALTVVTADGAVWSVDESVGNVYRQQGGSTETIVVAGTSASLTLKRSLCSKNSVYVRRGSNRYLIAPDLSYVSTTCAAGITPSEGYYFGVNTSDAVGFNKIDNWTCGLPPEVTKAPPMRMRQRDDSFNTPRMPNGNNSPGSLQESLRMTWSGAYLMDDESCTC